ncbi:hypothetical protein GWK47_032989 [Chionoecetes opilio]|uniref:Uncharacterized protein n=1 Tax=Chionoecetes opilio TaxID=41210 RepID=A0A8J4YPW0_CHIOP|nr:hypothetical protein GWK47_032989 [Chionoecetes opilio]
MALAIHGLDGELEDGGMVWLDLHPREGTVGEMEKFFIVLPEWFFASSLLQEGQCVVLRLLAVSLVAKNSTRSSDVSTVSLRGIHEGPSITESFEDSNVGTRGRAEAGFEESLRITSWTLFEAVVSKTEGVILSLTPASSTSFKTTAATFLPVESDLPGPQKELGVIFPVRRTAMRSSVRQRGTGGVFRPNAGPTSGISGFSAVPRSSRGLLSPRNSCSMDRALRDRHTPNVHSKNLGR